MATLTKKKRILILVENLSVPFDRRVWLEATTLHEAGYEVSVISIRNPGEKKKEVLDGVQIYRYMRPPQTSGALSYIFEFSYCEIMTFWLTLRATLSGGFDAIHACNPPDTFFAIGLVYKLFGKKFVFDQHDLCPEVYLSRFGDSKGLLFKALLALEQWTYKTADIVLSTNESYRDIALARGRKDPGNVFVVRTGPDLTKLNPVTPIPALKKGAKYLVCYLGVMGPQDGVDYLLRAINVMVHKQGRRDTKFVLIGKGDATNALKDMTRDFNLNEFVEFTGRIPDVDLINWLSTADVCVCPDPKNPLNDKSTMNKTMEYMSMEKPIVAFDLTETKYSAQEAALYAAPNDEADFADKINQLLDDPSLRKTMGKIGRRRVEEVLAWNYNKVHLLAAYKKLFSASAS